MTPFEQERLIIAFLFILKSVLGLDSKLCSHPCKRCDTTVIYMVPWRHKGGREVGLTVEKGYNDHGNEPGSGHGTAPSRPALTKNQT